MAPIDKAQLIGRHGTIEVPSDLGGPESLASVVDRTLHMDCVKDPWDDLLRVAASSGRVSSIAR